MTTAPRPRGFSADEVTHIMGGPMPTDPAQRRAYARLACTRLEEFDKVRFSEAFLLGDAPDDLLDEWRALSRDNTRRLRAPGAKRPQSAPRLALAKVAKPVREDDDAH